MRRIRAEARYQTVTDNRSGYKTNLMQVKKYAPRGNPVERLAHLGKTAGLSPPEEQNLYKQYGVSMARNPVVISDPDAKARMQKMKPLYVY